MFCSSRPVIKYAPLAWVRPARTKTRSTAWGGVRSQPTLCCGGVFPGLRFGPAAGYEPRDGVAAARDSKLAGIRRQVAGLLLCSVNVRKDLVELQWPRGLWAPHAPAPCRLAGERRRWLVCHPGGSRYTACQRQGLRIVICLGLRIFSNVLRRVPTEKGRLSPAVS